MSPYLTSRVHPAQPAPRASSAPKPQSLVDRVAARVGVENPQSAEELLTAVDRAIATADARRAAAASLPKTQAQLDDEFDRGLEKPRYVYSAQEDAEYRALFGDAS